MLVSLGTRLSAEERKATKQPSALIVAMLLLLFPYSPPVLTLDSSVAPVLRSRMYTFRTLGLVPPETRFVAEESKAMKRPSALIAGPTLSPLASFPAVSTLARSVV